MLKSLLQAPVRPVLREVMALSRHMGSEFYAAKVDSHTPRVPILTKFGDSPIIKPVDGQWYGGAVYDGRPIFFKDKWYVYFCGQPSYRADRLLFVGVAELKDGVATVHPAPVLYSDIESSGIDIPAYTVVDNKIIAVYFDDYGPERTGKTAKIFMAESEDGIAFSKVAIDSTAFNLTSFSRFGLPWLLSDSDGVRLYMRGKSNGKNVLLMSFLDVDARRVSAPQIVAQSKDTLINVAVTKRNGTYFLMYGQTTGGGFYIVSSNDGLSFDFSSQKMIVSHGCEWGWDFWKICPSPDNLTNDTVSLCWTGGNRLSIGYGTFSAKKL